MEAQVAGDVEAIVVFSEGGSHGFEVFGYEGDAVGLFDAELAGVADCDAVDGVGGNGGDDGEVIDDLGGERSCDVHAARAVGGGVDLYGADEFAVMLLERAEFSCSTECGDHI